jgi:predicted metal-dependent phosphotriesterase family hydrolase
VISLGVLVKEGYEDHIVVAHDIHTKNRLTKYGGHGYSHILKSIVPKMLRRGFTQAQVDKVRLVDHVVYRLTLINLYDFNVYFFTFFLSI